MMRHQKMFPRWSIYTLSVFLISLVNRSIETSRETSQPYRNIRLDTCRELMQAAELICGLKVLAPSKAYSFDATSRTRGLTVYFGTLCPLQQLEYPSTTMYGKSWIAGKFGNNWRCHVDAFPKITASPENGIFRSIMRRSQFVLGTFAWQLSTGSRTVWFAEAFHQDGHGNVIEGRNRMTAKSKIRLKAANLSAENPTHHKTLNSRRKPHKSRRLSKSSYLRTGVGYAHPYYFPADDYNYNALPPAAYTPRWQDQRTPFYEDLDYPGSPYLPSDYLPYQRSRVSVYSNPLGWDSDEETEEKTVKLNPERVKHMKKIMLQHLKEPKLSEHQMDLLCPMKYKQSVSNPKSFKRGCHALLDCPQKYGETSASQQDYFAHIDIINKQLNNGLLPLKYAEYILSKDQLNAKYLQRIPIHWKEARHDETASRCNPDRSQTKIRLESVLTEKSASLDVEVFREYGIALQFKIKASKLTKVIGTSIKVVLKRKPIRHSFNSILSKRIVTTDCNDDVRKQTLIFDGESSAMSSIMVLRETLEMRMPSLACRWFSDPLDEQDLLVTGDFELAITCQSVLLCRFSSLYVGVLMFCPYGDYGETVNQFIKSVKTTPIANQTKDNKKDDSSA